MRLALIIFALCALAAKAAPAPSPLAKALELRAEPEAARSAVGGNPLLRDLLDWMLLRGGESNISLPEALDLLARHPDWPVDVPLRKSIEALFEAQTSPDIIARFFAERDPASGPGLAALLRAAQARGDAAAIAHAQTEIWPRLRLDRPAQNALIVEFGPLLQPHALARSDYLLWRGRRDEAALMVPLLDAEGRADLAARLAYLGDDPRAGVLDAGRGGTAGLAFARFDWLARKGSFTEASDFLLARRGADALGQPARWAKWRGRLARWALRRNDGMRAATLAENAHLTPEDGAAYADLKWLAGYAALAALNAPQTARAHFQDFIAAVQTPISRGRGWYWQGRAEAASGQSEAARQSWAEAAAYQTSFYGQIAAEEIGAPFPAQLIHGRLGATPLIADAPLVQALDALVVAGERGAAYRFTETIGAKSPPRTLRIAANRLAAREAYFLALRLGKAAARRGEMIPEVLFPLHPVVDLPEAHDPALILAIARQESEFRADAGSSAGALGLMQLMPGTAELMAKKLNQPYREAALAVEWRYNAQLGIAYLQQLEAQFGPSPVLIAAAYNAGPGRVRDWIAARGDPRRPDVDSVAWVEAIPFDETRNYVMRVAEAIRPYEARLTGAAPTRSMAQILRGGFPLIRPRARPAGLGHSAAPQTSLRPRARPAAPPG